MLMASISMWLAKYRQRRAAEADGRTGLHGQDRRKTQARYREGAKSKRRKPKDGPLAPVDPGKVETDLARIAKICQEHALDLVIRMAGLARDGCEVFHVGAKFAHQFTPPLSR